MINVIVEDMQSDDAQNNLTSQSQSIYKISAQKNPTMEEIFKNGCPDLANVYEYVKKRRVSLKTYMNFNKNKENKENKSIKTKGSRVPKCSICSIRTLVKNKKPIESQR